MYARRRTKLGSHCARRTICELLVKYTRLIFFATNRRVGDALRELRCALAVLRERHERDLRVALIAA